MQEQRSIIAGEAEQDAQPDLALDQDLSTDDIRAKVRRDLQLRSLARTRPTISIVLHTDTQGSLEAILAFLQKCANPFVNISVLRTKIGEIDEESIQYVAAAGAQLVAFSLPPTPERLQPMLDIQSVKVHEYAVIYHLIDYIAH